MKPILATDYDESKLKFPYFVQPKIDGVRGIFLPTSPIITGRSLKPFPNVLVAEQFTIPGVDGEITYGSITSSSLCRDTTSVVNTHNDSKALDLVHNAFDYITDESLNMGYEQRYELLLKKNVPNVVESTLIRNLDDLLELELKYVNSGYEGVILRNPLGKYKFGRSTVKENNYLRIKRFIQEDALVIDIVEAMENTNPKTTNELGSSTRSSHKDNLIPKGVLGSLICKDIKTGDTITVGPGEMTHEYRAYYWNNKDKIINKVISYKHFPHGAKDKPRFPTFVAVRDVSDLVTE